MWVRGTRMRALCACVPVHAWTVHTSSSQSVIEDLTRLEALTHGGTWGFSSPFRLSDDRFPEWIFS